MKQGVKIKNREQYEVSTRSASSAKIALKSIEDNRRGERGIRFLPSSGENIAAHNLITGVRNRPWCC